MREKMMATIKGTAAANSLVGTINADAIYGYGGPDKLTVSIWLGEDRRVVTEWPVPADVKEVA